MFILEMKEQAIMCAVSVDWRVIQLIEGYIYPYRCRLILTFL